eukprot:TRINITY_DN11317_c0_g1_i16.p1 TRINITY_DN11317_c0_g1~~TRINITY_DN11317_c0_g1_i16.p1  ORF type:complete len:302 (-),score=73.09 TRINITY_DN11317_c0_g1_i16:395-1300(-)
MATTDPKQVLQTNNPGLMLGIIGGSGLDNPDLLQHRTEKAVEVTPFGAPSDSLVCGEISGVPVAILARHGRKHTIFPTAVNFRANLYALKSVGCTHVLATTACGSLREELHPGHLVMIDQYIDRTTKRASTFYDGTNWEQLPGVLHLPQAEPFSKFMRNLLLETCQELGYGPDHAVCKGVHDKGTMVSIEGPRFSSRSESHMFRSWGADLINMTSCPEVCLAGEAGLPYAAVALSTDYDCWRENEEGVSVEAVLATLKSNVESATKLILAFIPKLKEQQEAASKEAADCQAMANGGIMLYP